MTTTTPSVGPTVESLPPLLGDEHGKYRILILGNSGSGKSTTAREVASILSIPLISLDELHWGPGWTSASADELKLKVAAVLDATGGTWLVEGDYNTKLGPLVLDQTTDVIWLDPPLALYFPRILLRTIFRLLRVEPPCSPGCPERLSECFFSKESILWWCLTHHRSNRERNTARMERIGIGCGKPGEDEEVAKRRRMRRLGGWGEERRVWLEGVKEMAKNQ